MWRKTLKKLLSLMLLVNEVSGYYPKGVCGFRWGAPVCCEDYLLFNSNYKLTCARKCDTCYYNCDDCICQQSAEKVHAEQVSSTQPYLCETKCDPQCLNGICNMGNCLCFKGYRKSNTVGVCEPICESACINANCTGPNTCTCHENYTQHPDESNKCVPMCKKCSNGDCIGPNQCQCHNRFIWDDNKMDCIPFCKSGCLNGDCIMPDICVCHKGYTFDHHLNICLPVCDRNCVNSECVAPGYCKCHKNFKKHTTELNICEPICNPGCINSVCVAPNKCSCLQNHTKNITSMEHECHPVCEKCNNGQCVQPNKCICNSGYRWDDLTNDCVPVCQPPCVNSTCFKPSECKCIDGFMKNSISEHICEPYTDCENNCSLPAIRNNLYNNNNDSITFFCKDEGYVLDDTGERCQPVCQPSCIDSKCIAPDTCFCGESFYKPLNNESHICSLKPCKKDDIMKNIIKISLHNNETCFDSPVLQLFEERCAAEFTNNSCYDMLCVNNDYEICNMTYVCSIVFDDLNVTINETRCVWKNSYENLLNESVDESKTFSMRGEKNILHRYINEWPCLTCLCPVEENRGLCSNNELVFRLCDCPNEGVTNSDRSEVSHKMIGIGLIIFGIISLCGIAIFILRNKYFTKKSSDKYKVEAFMNKTYDVNETVCINDYAENEYEEIPCDNT